MTTDLEKQFFETFEINKPTLCKYAIYGYEGEQEIWYKCNKRDEECYTYPNRSACKDKETDYPQITDRILLELILITMHHEDLFGYPTNMQELKDNTLKQLIEIYNKFSTCVTCDGEYQETARNIKNQIQALFKGN